MKNFFLMMFCICSAFVCKAQVGINAEPENGQMFRVHTSEGEVVVRSDNGNLGIGTTSPQEKVHVEGNSRIEGDVTIGKDLILDGKGLVKESVSLKNGGGSAVLEIVKDASHTVSAGKIESDIDFSQNKYYLSSDEFGNAEWALLRPKAEIVGRDENKALKPLYTGTVGASGGIVGTGYTDITSNPITLTKGRWLILAKYSTQASTNNLSPSMIYTRLVSYPGQPKTPSGTGFFPNSIPADASVEIEFGVQPEQNGSSVALPQLFYEVHIDETKTFEIQSKRKDGNGFRLYGTRRGSFFIAIRLSDI